MLHHILTKENCYFEGAGRFQNDVSHKEALEEGLAVSSSLRVPLSNGKRRA